MALHKVARFVRNLVGGRERPLSETEFTEAFLRELREARPDVVVSALGPLHVEVRVPSGKSSTAFLHNAYELHVQAAGDTDGILQRYVASCLETAEQSDSIDPDRVVPVIKDRGWLDEVAAAADKDAEAKVQQVWEELSPELVVVYAEDTPTSIRYISKDEFGKLAWDYATLRKRAVANLQRLLPEVKRHGSEGVFMFTAGGDYEASLLLFPDLWTKENLPVKGEVVFAIPTRDLLVITGSGEPAGLERLSALVQDATEKGSYRLTPVLFTYNAGVIQRYGVSIVH